MLKASEGLKVPQIPKIIHSHVVSPCSGLSSSHSLGSSKGNQLESGSLTTDDKVGVRKIGTPASTSQDGTSMTMTNSMVSATAAAIMPRGNQCYFMLLIFILWQTIGFK